MGADGLFIQFTSYYQNISRSLHPSLSQGDTMKKVTILLILSIMALATTSAEVYLVDLCGESSLQDKGNYYEYGNDCIGFNISKTGYNPNSVILDKLHNQTFQLLMQGVTEVSLQNGQERERNWQSETWTISISSGYPKWVSSDGVFTMGYIIYNNTFKTVANITNYPFFYPSSYLSLRYLTKKNQNDIVTFIPPIVNGIEQQLNVTNQTSGGNLIQRQYLGRGSSIVIDPVYVVDYSPNPATHLINGDVDFDPESSFQNLIGITSGMSDNLTSTNYGTDKRTETYPAFVWYKEQDVVDTTKVTSVGGTNSNVHHEYVGSDWGRLLLTGGAVFKNGDDILVYMKPVANSDKNRTVYLKDPTNTFTLGTFNTGNDTASYSYITITLANVPNGTTDVRFHDNSIVTGGFDVQYDYVQAIVYNETGTAISGRWATTYNPIYNWYLGIYKTTATTREIWVYGYQNSNSLAVSYSVNQNLSGTGWFYIPVNSILNYEKNTANLSFSQLRFFSFDSANFSEMVLRAEANDTQAPTITNCTFNVSGYSCNQTALASCDVIDDTAITYVYFDIDGVNTSTTKQDNKYYYILNDTGFANTTHNWSYTYAFDLLDNANSTFVNKTVQYLCQENITCMENWVANPINCQVNDSYFLTYNDTNVCNTTFNLPLDNGTYQFCNYCSEDLIQTLGNCTIDNNQTVDYIDFNYLTCCQVTNLSSDCTIEYYPYNETTSQYCDYYPVEIGELTCPSQFDFTIREKEYCLAQIPLNYSNESFKCYSYVVVAGETHTILQTNPEYRERTQTFIDLGKDPETRTYFEPANGMVNFYITDKNLLPEYNYILDVRCCSDQRCLESSHPFTLGYQSQEYVFFRTKWLMANAPYIIGGIILLFLIIGVLIIIARNVA